MIFDGATHRIVLEASDGDSVQAVELYSRWKDWVQAGAGAGFAHAFTVVGGDPLGGGVFAGSYFFLNTTNGWLIRPREEAHRLTVTGNLYPYDPGAALFADTLGAYQVQVNLTTSSLTQSVSVDLAAVMDSQGFTQSRAKQLDLIKAILGMV